MEETCWPPSPTRWCSSPGRIRPLLLLWHCRAYRSSVELRSVFVSLWIGSHWLSEVKMKMKMKMKIFIDFDCVNQFHPSCQKRHFRAQQDFFIKKNKTILKTLFLNIYFNKYVLLTYLLYYFIYYICLFIFKYYLQFCLKGSSDAKFTLQVVEHKCVLEVCVHIHPIMIKIHPVVF